MKRIAYGVTVGIFVVGFIMGLSIVSENAFADEALAASPGPVIAIATPMVKMDKKATVVIMGAGFSPGQEVKLIFTTNDGSKGDIGYALKPPPVANAVGTWMTTWSCGRYIAKKLIKPGAYSVMATDSEYGFLAHAPLVFYSE